jgi:1-acyl-sn-glycerol-3-phosphate acyltransferase
MSEHSQMSLMKEKRFAPLFWTQFMGAFNDNLYKNALIMLLTFGAIAMPSGLSSEIAVQISGALFILPFLLFSAWAGEIADKNEKSQLIRYLKILEIVIGVVGSIGLAFTNIYLMWLALFGLGVQATFFGPIKYSILPQQLKETELVGGNALIESGTFIAILLGTIAGGLLIGMKDGWHYVSAGTILVAIFGYITSKKIPEAPAVDPGLKISFNIIKPSIATIKIAKEVKSVYLSILGISWFWFVGAILLTQFPAIVKNIIGGGESLVTLLLGLFSIGTGLGSMLCEKMSGKKVEIGLVPFGSFGLSLFSLDLYFSLSNFHQLNNVGITGFYIVNELLNFQAIRISLDLFLLSMFGGFFIVPLYALIQSRSKANVKSRVIAGNNIINSLFMVGSAIFGIIMFSLGAGVKELILSVCILNALVAIYIFTIVPEFMLRFMVWMLTHTIYRVNKIGLDKIPEEGAALLICNHVSFLDGLMIFGACQRPVKFVMYYKIFNIPIFKYLFNSAGAIPIASKSEDEDVLNAAYDKINTYLAAGEIVVIFPEGKITDDGNMNEFKPGILKILEKQKVSIIPTAISGLWGSMYSKKDKGIMRYLPKAFFNHKVSFIVGECIEAKDVNLKDLENKILKLRGENK